MADRIKTTPKRKMHTLPLYESDALHKVLETHRGFRTKTDLMITAFDHFSKCRFSKFRNVSDAQSGIALERADSYIQGMLGPVDLFGFVDLIDNLGIAARNALANSHWDLLVQMASRMNVTLTALPTEPDSYASSPPRAVARVGRMSR